MAMKPMTWAFTSLQGRGLNQAEPAWRVWPWLRAGRYVGGRPLSRPTLNEKGAVYEQSQGTNC